MSKSKLNILSILIPLLLIFVVAFIVFRHKNSNAKLPLAVVETPFMGLVQNTKQIRGKIVARQTIALKPQVSGIIDKIYVKVGDKVSKEQAVAKIKVMPSPDEIEDAQKHLKTNEIQYELDKRLYEENCRVHQLGGVPASKLKEFEAGMNISKLNYDASVRKLQMLLENSVIGKNNEDFTIVRSTISGTVMHIPFETGSSVSKRTSSSDGTTIAQVANLNKLVFEGKINEADIGKINVGMKLELSISSMDSFSVKAIISEISPQSQNEGGINKFAFSAAFNPQDYALPYSGISAKANILIAQTDSAICIEERYLQFENDKPYVELWDAHNIVKKEVKTGLSDGVNVEIQAGLTLDDQLVLPNWTEQ